VSAEVEPSSSKATSCSRRPKLPRAVVEETPSNASHHAAERDQSPAGFYLSCLGRDKDSSGRVALNKSGLESKIIETRLGTRNQLRKAVDPAVGKKSKRIQRSSADTDLFMLFWFGDCRFLFDTTKLVNLNFLRMPLHYYFREKLVRVVI
jgi:hypothetical protein